MVFVEHPSAMSTHIAFMSASSLMIWRAVMPRLSISMTAMPACLASSRRLEYTAGIVPLPGSAMPMASQRQFIEFAVYMPEHEPHVGHALHSHSCRRSSSILPAM